MSTVILYMCMCMCLFNDKPQNCIWLPLSEDFNFACRKKTKWYLRIYINIHDNREHTEMAVLILTTRRLSSATVNFSLYCTCPHKLIIYDSYSKLFSKLSLFVSMYRPTTSNIWNFTVITFYKIKQFLNIRCV